MAEERAHATPAQQFARDDVYIHAMHSACMPSLVYDEEDRSVVHPSPMIKREKGGLAIGVTPGTCESHPENVKLGGTRKHRVVETEARLLQIVRTANAHNYGEVQSQFGKKGATQDLIFECLMADEDEIFPTKLVCFSWLEKAAENYVKTKAEKIKAAGFSGEAGVSGDGDDENGNHGIFSGAPFPRVLSSRLDSLKIWLLPCL